MLKSNRLYCREALTVKGLSFQMEEKMKAFISNVAAKYKVVLLIGFMLMIGTGFIMPVEKAQEPVHKDIPGSPVGKLFQTVHDQVDDQTASKNQAFGGDDFKNGKYERPFTQEMVYIPQVDLVTIKLNREDPLWIYVQIKVNKAFAENRDVKADFLVELDTDLDNRGNFLIVTAAPSSTQWSTATVRVLSNPDMNVGGVNPVKPDTSLSEGRGYYEDMFNEGNGNDPDLAWSRLSKDDPAMVEIAFKNTLTGGEKGKFIWLPWSDAGMKDWSLYEFNDHFTLEQAGYPSKDDPKNYPLKALWGVDNTCREPSGFTPTGSMPGLCLTYQPENQSDEKKNCICKPRTGCACD